jgi:hypothetical protein
MMPGGHLATSAALAGVAYAVSGSLPVAAGCFAGGFLIDVDHYLDYLVFEKQWRRPGPLNFLRYYFGYCPQKLVLPLHSFELMTVLAVINLLYPTRLLVGYWFGAAMHLVCDILVNGDHALKRPVLFYFFGYRISQKFAAKDLLDVIVPAEAGKRPIREFFKVTPLGDHPARVAAADKARTSI